MELGACCSVHLHVMVVAFVLASLHLHVAADNEQCNYKIVTVTGNDVGAATDSGISVRLENSHEDRVTFLLDNGLNDFERGQVDTFLVVGDCVENICKVVLYTDNKGFFPRWYVETIKVNGKTFPMHSWLPRDDGLNTPFIIHNECHYATIGSPTSHPNYSQGGILVNVTIQNEGLRKNSEMICIERNV